MEDVIVKIGEVKYRTHITMRDHSIVADEPHDLGGNDDGPEASELLLASLGTCTAITLRMYADRKEWPLEAVDVKLNMNKETEAGKLTTNIERKIMLKGNLDEDQRKRLLQIANKCPVHKILTSTIEINSEVL